MSDIPDEVPQPDEDEDDWTKYADTGYGSSAYDPWSDLVEVEEEDDELDDEFAFEDEEAGRSREVPRCPAPAGQAELVRRGTCDTCIGRVSGTRLAEGTLAENGARVRAEALERDADLSVDAAAEYCPFCEDLFAEVDLIVGRIIDALGGVDFAKFQIGAQFDKGQIAAEEELRNSLAAPGSAPLKSSLVSALTRGIREVLPGAKAVRESPEVMILVNTLTLGIEVDIRAVFVYGRYRKFSRELPQTRWPCRACRGRDGGCEACEFTGQQYPASTQSLVCDPMMDRFGADADAFHGMGREDIDVRTLGNGRPFVAEMKRPMRRAADLEELTAAINEAADGRIEVHGLRMSNRAEVARIKGTAAEKSYTIRFTVADAFEPERATALIQALSGLTLEQQTPQRVAHRRADKVRKRKVIEIGDIVTEDQEIQFRVRCESGTYVKELVHSDEGRTTPSVAGVLESECEVLWLDVEDVHAD